MGVFQVVEIHCDNEFQAALDPIATIQSPPIHMNYSNPQNMFLRQKETTESSKKEYAHVIITCPMYISPEH